MKSKVDPEYWKPCKGCKDGHPTYWKTVVESPQWLAWEKEVARRMHKQINRDKMFGVFDIDECRECNIISPEHFQEFMKFSARRKT